MDVKGYQIEFKADVLHFIFHSSTDPEALDAALKVTTELIEARGTDRFAIITDVSNRTESSAEGRKLISDFLKRIDGPLKNYCRGWAVVTTSTVIRGAFTAIMWFKPLPCPHKVVDTVAAAQTWLATRQ